MKKGEMEYDRIAGDYQVSKLLPFRKYIEGYTLFQMLGDINGKTLFDFACGEGHYTRELKKAGAHEILGVDISSEMISLAKEQERKNPIGCQYQWCDITCFEREEMADIITGMYLLNYAKSANELLSFCRIAHCSLHSEGIFLGFNDNIFADPEKGNLYHRYGFYKTHSTPHGEGASITYHFRKEDGSYFTFDNYYLSPKTYQWAFSTAGFRNFEWIHPVLNPKIKSHPFWTDFLLYPPIIGFRAVK